VKRRLTFTAILFFLLSLLLQYAVAPVAAVHDDGIFELEGNATDNSAPGDDWQNGTPGAADTLFIPMSVEGEGPDTSYFKGGGSKDENALSQWAWDDTDVAPDKDELMNVFAAVYETGAGTLAYFGADKFDDSGDAQIGFWFFQDNISLNANGNFNGTHTKGDVLVLSDFTNGGDVDLICVYKWDTAAGGDLSGTGCDENSSDNLHLVAAGAECDVSTPDDSLEVCAAVNPGTENPGTAAHPEGFETAYWAFTNKDGHHHYDKGQFFEGGINLSTMFGGDAPCFSTFLAETRSSQETDAQLKDFALGSLDTCVPPDLETESSVSAADFGAQVTDTATLSGSHGAVKGTIDFFICEPDEVTSGGCEGDAGTKVGSSVTIANDEATSAAYTVGLTAGAVGTYCWRAEYTPAADSEYLATTHTNAGSECFDVAPASIDVEKEADDDSVAAGDNIGFTVTLSNTGNNTALGIAFSDDLPSGTGVSWSLDAANSDPGWSVTGSAPDQHLVFSPTSLAGKSSTSAHVVSGTTASSCGSYDNTASVTTTSDGSDEASDSVFVECPGLAIDKVDNTGSYDEVGDVISYSITVTNTGNVTLNNVVVTDPNAVGLDCLPAAGNQTTIPSLAAGASVVCSASHTVTQADLDAGHYWNQACADDNDGDGEAGANPVCDDVDTPGEQSPELSIVKDDGGATYDEVGDVIHYTIVATNTGNVTLHDVVITDPNAVNLVCNPALPVADLAPGDSISCTAEHVVTQDDLDAGSYLNTACVDDEMGEQGAGADEACDDEETPGEQNPVLDIVKDDGDATYDEVGDVIHYTIVATNIGNVTLHDVVVTDPNAVNLVCNPALPVADLAPGDEISCTAEHTVTQADIDAGSYLNTACVDDEMGAEGAGADAACDDENTPGSQNPELSIVKDDGGATYDEVGDVINYTIVATNIGNVTLKGVVVTDALVDAGSLVCTPATPVDLAPGESISCTATHTVTQDDLDNGVYLNTACANDTDGPAAEVCDDEDTPGEQNPALAITKDVAEVEFTDVGQVLHYTIVVTNVGNVTLHDVVVTDAQVSDLVCTPATPIANLAVGDSFTCTATHTTTQEDLDAGFYFNQACADDGMGDGEEGAAPVCDDVTTPGQQVEQETDVPTQPNTSAVEIGGSSSPSDGSWLLVLALVTFLASIVLVTPRRGRQPR
jgi:uncharacterized repeat protein (TIGR01451 family)